MHLSQSGVLLHPNIYKIVSQYNYYIGSQLIVTQVSPTYIVYGNPGPGPTRLTSQPIAKFIY